MASSNTSNTNKSKTAAGEDEDTKHEEEKETLLNRNGAQNQFVAVPVKQDVEENVQSESDPYQLSEKEQVTLYWENVHLEIKKSQKKNICKRTKENDTETAETTGNIQILRGMSGCAKAGELTCIMGASGGGKTTLLSVITGRIREVSSLASNSVLSGNIQLNNIRVDCSQDSELNYLLKNIKFVMQHDVLYATEKCAEAINVSSKLRLRNNASDTVISEKERQEIVEYVMQALSLEKCAHTFIGGEEIRGLSGGERTRTSMGIELVTNPTILVADEPTSGLDSASAYDTMLLLKELARLGRTVIVCIHQPSVEILEQIDRLLMLAKGKVVYEGGIPQLFDYLRHIDYECPPHSNVTDYFVQQLNRKPQYFIDEWQKYTRTHKLYEDLPQLNSSEIASASSDLRQIEPVPMVSCCKQLSVLVQRFFWIFVRESSNRVRLYQGVGEALLLGIIWYQMPLIQEMSWSADEQGVLTNLNNRMGGLFMAVAFTTFNSMAEACIAFPSEKLIFEKERSGRWYYTSVFLLAKLMLTLPFDALLVLLFSVISKWMCNFNMTFGDYFVGLLLITLASNTFAYLLSMFVPNARRGAQVMPILTNFVVLFSGMFIAVQSIPAWLRWLRFVNPYFYGLSFLAIAEFADVQSSDGVAVGDEYLERMGYDPFNKYFCLVVLTILYVGVRLLASIALMIQYGW